MRIILGVILIIAAVVIIYNQIKLEIQGKRLKAEVKEET